MITRRDLLSCPSLARCGGACSGLVRAIGYHKRSTDTHCFQEVVFQCDTCDTQYKGIPPITIVEWLREEPTR